MKTTMNKLRRATPIIFAMFVFCASGPTPTSGHVIQRGRPADRVIATKVIEGTVVRFERGDYLWVVVKDSAGKERYFDMPDQRSAQYFLAEQKGKPLVITDRIVNRYIPEAGHRTKDRHDESHQVWKADSR